MTTERDLLDDFLRDRISRRQFVIRSLALGLSLSSIGTVLAACGQAAPTQEATPQPAAKAVEATATAAPPTPTPKPVDVQELVLAGAKDVVGLDPTQNNDNNSTLVLDLILDSVALLDEAGNVTPHLAESWDVSEDGLTYTYHFRKGVTFHDGSDLTADDVIFTIERILENKYPEGRKKEKIEMIDTFKKIDDYTVEIKIQFPYTAFTAAFGVQYILPKAAVEALGDEGFNKAPVGSGPFKFVEWRPNDFVALEGFDDYWLVNPKLDKVTIRPIPENAVAVANLIAGDVDIISDVVGPNLEQLRGAADRGIEILSADSNSYFFAGFRMVSAPFTDLRFRQAVYLATDFEATVKAIFPPEIARRAYGTVPPGLWPQDEDYLKSIALKQDQAKAKELFDELIAEGVMAADEKIIVAPPPDDARISVAEIMVTDLQSLGINAEIVKMEWGAYLEAIVGEQNMIYMLGTTPAIPDPDANVRWLFGEDSAHTNYLNLTPFADYSTWDEMIKQAQKSQNRDERAQLYQEVVRATMEQVVHIPLYHQNAIMAKHSYVKEFDVSPRVGWDLVRPWANVFIEGKTS